MKRKSTKSHDSFWNKFFSMLDSVTKWVNRFVFIASIMIILVLIIGIALQLKKGADRGFSFFNKKMKITIESSCFDEGMNFWKEFDYEKAEENFLIALDEICEVKGEGSLEAAELSRILGSLYLDMGKYEESYELLNSAYVTFCNKLGVADGNTVISKCQIGNYDIRTGNIERGFITLNEAYDETGYAEYKIQIVQMIANTYLGNYKKALDLYQVLEPCEKKEWNSTEAIVSFYNDYGVLMIDLGEYDRALEYLAIAVQEWKALEIEEDTTFAGLCINLAKVFALHGQYEDAMEAGDKAMSVLQSLYADDNILTAKAYENMALVYGDMRMLDIQIEYLESALTIAMNSVGKNHQITAEIYNAFGDYYADSGDLESAVKNYKDALEIRKNLLGKNSLVTAAVYKNLAECYMFMDKQEESMEYAREAVEICESLCGRDNINTADAYVTLAQAYEKNGDEVMADEFNQIAIDIIGRHVKFANQMAAQLYRTAGDIYIEQKNCNKASDLYWKSWLVYHQLFTNEDSYATEFDDRLKTLYDGLKLSDEYEHWVWKWKNGEFENGEDENDTF